MKLSVEGEMQARRVMDVWLLDWRRESFRVFVSFESRKGMCLLLVFRLWTQWPSAERL